MSQASFAILRQSADPQAVDAIERLVESGSDRRLNRINVLDFARHAELDEEAVIGAFLHSARLGLFELSWNMLCPGCGGVLDAGETLRTIDRSEYACTLCAAGYEPTLDETVEVTFTVMPQVRRIAAHDPHTMPMPEYLRQIFWSSGMDVPDDFEDGLENVLLEAVELPPGERAILSLQLPPGMVIAFDPVTHTSQFLQVEGEPTRERQSLTMPILRGDTGNPNQTLRPGPLRLTLINQSEVRTLPALWLANDKLHELLGRRKPFLTAKRLLSNQTFRDIYRAESLDPNQRLKITSLTFLFTDLRGSTELYDRVGDLVAFDLVRAHFRLLTEIIAAQSGAVVKTMGDAIMATFPTPDRAMSAALRIREAMHDFNRQQQRDDLLLKIGIHEGPCLAVMLNDRQDYFGTTVNIASRVQGLATRSILATDSVIQHADASRILASSGLTPIAQAANLRGLSNVVTVYEIP